MTTVTPSRPVAPRPAAPRPRVQPPQGRSGPAIDPFRVIRRYLLLIIASGIAGVFVGVGVFFLLNFTYPLYSGQALFALQPTISDPTAIMGDDMRYGDLVTRQQQTETVLLISREVIGKALEHPSIRETAWAQQFIVAGARPGESDTFLLDDAVDDLIDSIVATVPRDTTLFGMIWSTHRASDVPVVLNQIADTYLLRRRAMDQEALTENQKLFANELSNTTRAIDDLSQEIENFVRDRGITSLDDPRYSQIAVALTDLNENIAESKSALTSMESAYAQTGLKLQGTIQPDDADILAARGNTLVLNQEKAVDSAKLELRLLKEKYKDGTPMIVQAENTLRALELEYQTKLDTQIKGNLDARLKQLSLDIDRLRKVLDNLETDYEQKEVLLRDLAADFSRYQDLESRRTTLATKRDGEMQMLKEIELMRFRVDAARVKLAQQAQTPRDKSFPNALIVVPLCTIACLALTVGLIFLREITDQRVKTASDLEVVPNARVLGVIPELTEDPMNCECAEMAVHKHPHCVLAESYRQIANPIAEMMERSNHQTLLLVGGLPGTGTTTATSNLASAEAATGRRVCAIDANFRRPRLAQAMGVNAESEGLGELLHGESSLDQVIQQSPCGADVISAGHPSRRVFERLNTQQFARVIAELRDRYDMILIDAPPAVAAGDAMMLANKVDATVLVIRAHQEQRGLVARLVNRLSESQSEFLGIMLNRPRGTAGGYFKRNYATMAAYAKADKD